MFLSRSMRVVVSIALVMILLVALAPAIGTDAQDAALRDFLPAAKSVGPDFVIIEDRARTLVEQAAAFANADDAAQRLAAWGWQENAFTVYQSTALTPAGAPAATLDISLTRFAAPAGAAAALPYFLEDRAAVLGQRETPAPFANPPGDEARVVSGDVGTGFDTTLYVRSGPLLLRISATAAASAPFAAPEDLAREIIARAAGIPQSVAPTGVLADFLPWSSPLPDGGCSRVGEENGQAIPAAMERFDGIPDAAATLAAMRWQEGFSRQFGCDNPPPDGAGWLNLGVHRFADADAAASAVHVFAKSRAFETGLDAMPPPDLAPNAAAIGGETVNGTEYSLYLSSGPLLFRVTAVAPAGDPRQDAIAIATALLQQSAVPPQSAIPTPTPWPTAVPTATSVPIPTAAPPPTLAPLPTATPVLTPTPIPTVPPPPPPLPTATATPLPPTSPPSSLPTATSGPLPTPTPRVINLPTPAGD